MPYRFASAALCLSGLVLLSGCFIERAGLGGSDGSTAPFDAGPDADLDGGGVPPDDAFTPESGPACALADERCEGNVRRYCESGMLASEACSALQHCDDSGGFPVCVANVCVPDMARCSLDMTEATLCDSRGTEETTSVCTRGCSAGTCRPQTACGAAIFATMSSGTMRVDLCGAGADQSHTSACPFADQSPPGEDVLIRLEVDRRRPIRFQAEQVSGGETIDPTLFLRSACEEMGSEIWCREDTDGQDEDFTETLDPGDYFLVIDRHERGGTSCGELDVTITPM